jgi:hypothetical protein
MEVILVFVVLTTIVVLLAAAGHELTAVAVGILAFVVLLNVALGH